MLSYSLLARSLYPFWQYTRDNSIVRRRQQVVQRSKASAIISSFKSRARTGSVTLPFLILSPIALLIAAQHLTPLQSALQGIPMPLIVYTSFIAVAVLVVLMRQWVWVYWLALTAGHHLAWTLHTDPGSTLALPLITTIGMGLLTIVPRPPLPTLSGFTLLLVVLSLPLVSTLTGAPSAHSAIDTMVALLPEPVTTAQLQTLITIVFWLQGNVVLVALYTRTDRTAVHWGQAGIWGAFAALYLFSAGPGNIDLLTTVVCLVVLLALSMQMLHLAYIDELTQLPQRRALERHLNRLGRHSSITMLDVDHFKNFNDRHGHDAGDQVLKLLGAILGRERGVSAYRYGGEEFTLIFNHADEDRLQEKLESIRARVASYPLEIRHASRPKNKNTGKKQRGGKRNGRTVKITVSQGCATRQKGESPEQLLMRADKALYAAKKAGRNCVVLRA